MIIYSICFFTNFNLQKDHHHLEFEEFELLSNPCILCINNNASTNFINSVITRENIFYYNLHNNYSKTRNHI